MQKKGKRGKTCKKLEGMGGEPCKKLEGSGESLAKIEMGGEGLQKIEGTRERVCRACKKRAMGLANN